MFTEFVKFLLSLILVTIMQIFLVGCLWVLRVAIDWWLDVDYVEVIKKWMNQY